MFNNLIGNCFKEGEVTLSQDKIKGEEIPLILDKNTYEHIMSANINKINNLKEKQIDELEKIESRKNILKSLISQNKEIKNKIKLTKRILKEEKRKLKKVNKELKIRRDYIIEISDIYAEETENYVNFNSYTKQYTKKR